MNANANNFNPSTGYYAQGGTFYPPQQAQGNEYPTLPVAEDYSYEDPNNAIYPSHHPHEYQHQDCLVGAEQYYDHDLQHYDAGHYEDPSFHQAWANIETAEPSVEPGYFVPMPPLTPQIYSAPVSAIAYDAAYDAIYIAGHTQPFGERPRRASMLVTHRLSDGMLYSSCGGHPEADIKVLQTIYKSIYSGEELSATRRQGQNIPPSAYQPPYGLLQSPSSACIGITTLLPLTAGYVGSVSPSGVRVHSMGGLCVSDFEVEGMLCGAAHPESHRTHISVGGCNSQIHCLDVYQNLRTVSSHSLSKTYCSAMASNETKKALVIGCTDGTLRLIDGRMRGAEVAKLKSHIGGVSAVASSLDGTLLATTGFAAKSGALGALGPYAYPDPHVLVYDVRFLGRGGIVHPFSALKGNPRFLSFLPSMENLPDNRFLVTSGQRGGGMQILTPFEESDQNISNFVNPLPEPGEAITSMALADQHVAFGTSQSRLLQFQLMGYKEFKTKSALGSGKTIYSGTASAFRRDKSSSASTITDPSSSSDPAQEEKVSLEIPSYFPEPPSLSIDPSILLSEHGSSRMSSVFSSYIMCSDPVVSKIGSRENSSFGSIARQPLIPSSRRTVMDNVLKAGTKAEGDSALIVPVSAIDINLLPNESTSSSKGKKKQMLANPNKLLFVDNLSAAVYLADNRVKTMMNPDIVGKIGTLSNVRHQLLADDQGHLVIPERYKLALRPQKVSSSHFEHWKSNSTGLFPGWDYPPSMPSAHVPSLLVLLYFVGEIRAEILRRQFDKRLVSSKTVDQVPSLSTELGFLFHNMESIASHAMTYPGDSLQQRVGIFMPSSFLAAFTSMPEAVNLALLDDNPAVAMRARRPEAFYRFLLHQLDKEAGATENTKLIDSLYGINLVSINEFLNGAEKPRISKTRALTIDLTYDPFVENKETTKWRFGKVLRHALCRESKFRTWCNSTGSYETVVQRKVATSLPEILTLSCACAGRKAEEGLAVWRTSFDDYGHWLPEAIEVELEDTGNIIVREEVDGGDCTKEWLCFKGDSPFPKIVSRMITEGREMRNTKVRYRLEAVLSFVRDDMSSDASGYVFSGRDGEAVGHHVLHMRIPPVYRKRNLSKQRDCAEQLLKQMKENSNANNYQLTMTADVPESIIEARIRKVEQDLHDDKMNDWVLFNGFAVSSTTVEDARAFHVDFKEPCLVVFRSIESSDPVTDDEEEEPQKLDATTVLFSRSISTGKQSPCATKTDIELPGEGDIVALDAEFVSVQDEEAILGDGGNKIVIRDTRHVLARVSVIDCRTGDIIIDDYVLPREPVVDYLTRFSGIIPADLDPKTSPHHLVTARTAYLKLRCLMDRGCIFLGHGLSQDFTTANLFVPASQTIDTVEIYHKDRMRYVSLRFLTNYVLKRDMQQDVHDSVEDARAAFELYERAKDLLADGSFDKFLNDLYEYGAKTEWRVGVDDD